MNTGDAEVLDQGIYNYFIVRQLFGEAKSQVIGKPRQSFVASISRGKNQLNFSQMLIFALISFFFYRTQKCPQHTDDQRRSIRLLLLG